MLENQSTSKRYSQRVRAGLDTDHVDAHPTSKRLTLARNFLLCSQENKFYITERRKAPERSPAHPQHSDSQPNEVHPTCFILCFIDKHYEQLIFRLKSSCIHADEHI